MMKPSDAPLQPSLPPARNRLLAQLRAAVVLLALGTLLLGVAYPLAVTGIAQVAFPDQANGSLIEMDTERYVGSELLGQHFTSPEYFWGRPSASTPPYNPLDSRGSNLSPANPALIDAVNARVSALRKADPKNAQPVPADLVTASASGLDPHISVRAAQYQAGRVARARRLKEEQVMEFIDAHTEWPWLGFLGPARVNVLKLNMALDAGSGIRAPERK